MVVVVYIGCKLAAEHTRRAPVVAGAGGELEAADKLEAGDRLETGYIRPMLVAVVAFAGAGFEGKFGVVDIRSVSVAGMRSRTIAADIDYFAVD